MTGARIDSILLRLASDQADSGWNDFLERYSTLLLDIVHRYEHEKDRAQECFEYVCAKLSDNDFHRLTCFRPDGPAKFRTWLTAVVGNLCIDWRRSVYGRYRTPHNVRELPELDQRVFDCLYRHGMTRQECLHFLEARFPKLTEQMISEIHAGIHAVLTSRQRWQLSTRKTETVSIDHPTMIFSATDKGPESLTETDQEQQRLMKAMARLEPRQRLFLQLRFQQDLTLEEVARLTRLSDSFQARREIDAALAVLAKAMKF